MRSQAKGYEINLPYPFNLTMKECMQFANAVVRLHEMQTSEDGLGSNKDRQRAFSNARNNSKNATKGMRSNSKSTDTRREMDNKDLESTYNDGDDSTSKVVTKKKRSVSKEKQALSSKANEKTESKKKPVTIQTFIMKIYNIHKVGYNTGTFCSEDEEYSVDVRKSLPASNIASAGIKGDSQEFSEDDSLSNRFIKEECWPQNIWNECSKVDPHLLFDGRKRDGCREIKIADETEEKTT